RRETTRSRGSKELVRSVSLVEAATPAWQSRPSMVNYLINY
ncbi:Os06g0311700, partial [Oryza sativa Japonica Group]